MSEQTNEQKTRIEKMYDRVRELKEEAKRDANIDKAKLEDQFDSAARVMKWLNKRNDWKEVLLSLETKKTAAWRKAYEFYRTEYNIKLNNQEEYRMMIESDQAYCVAMQEYVVCKEVVDYITSVVDVLKGRSYDVSNFAKYIMWTRGHHD